MTCIEIQVLLAEKGKAFDIVNEPDPDSNSKIDTAAKRPTFQFSDFRLLLFCFFSVALLSVCATGHVRELVVVGGLIFKCFK